MTKFYEIEDETVVDRLFIRDNRLLMNDGALPVLMGRDDKCVRVLLVDGVFDRRVKRQDRWNAPSPIRDEIASKVVSRYNAYPELIALVKGLADGVGGQGLVESAQSLLKQLGER